MQGDTIFLNSTLFLWHGLIIEILPSVPYSERENFITLFDNFHQDHQDLIKNKQIFKMKMEIGSILCPW